MKYHKQKMFDKKGSCYPTVIACLLDLEPEEVPLFNLLYFNDEEAENLKNILKLKYFNRTDLSEIDFEQEENKKKQNMYFNEYFRYSGLWASVLESFLASKGYKEQFIDKKDMDKWIENHKDEPYILTGMSPRNLLHVAIYMNGKLLHDPHPEGGGVDITDRESPLSFLQKMV